MISSTASTAAAGSGPSALAAAFCSASRGARMPGMVVDSSGNDRQKRSAACAPAGLFEEAVDYSNRTGTILVHDAAYIDLNSWSGLGVYFVYLTDNQGHTVDVKKIVLQ